MALHLYLLMTNCPAGYQQSLITQPFDFRKHADNMRAFNVCEVHDRHRTARPRAPLMPSEGLQKENLYVTESAGFRGTPCLSTPNLITHCKNNNIKKKEK